MNIAATTASTAYAAITLPHQVALAQALAVKAYPELLLLDLAAPESSALNTAIFATDSGKKFQEAGRKGRYARIPAKDLWAIADYRNNSHVFPGYFENAPPIPITPDVPFLSSTQDL